MKGLLAHIAKELNTDITALTPLSGGDISRAYKLHTSDQAYFLKVNSGSSALQMFEAEKKGLECIAASKTIAVPRVFELGICEGQGFLLMEFIKSKTGSAEDFQALASQLAGMHQVPFQKFGFQEDNFIGSLAQSNTLHEKWSDFYLYQRLNPQIEMALTQGLLTKKELPSLDRMHRVLQFYFNKVRPSLLHGDLWSGNFLFGLDGTPYLIDPAIYYGHSEVDIAMTHLFGGFHSSFYETYHKIVPQSNETEARIALYQLYYLLVHLNLFGSSYYGGVSRILKHYF